MINSTNTCSPKKIITIMTTLMLVFLVIKLISIWYFTSRGVNLAFPYNSMLFDPFHRFSDWLIPFEWSKIENPYDMTNDLYNHIPPSTYTMFTFWLTSFGKHTYFIILILIAISVNYLIFEKIIDESNHYINTHIYFSFIIALYPLWFLIDRGNTDVFSFIFISITFYALLFRPQSMIVAIGIALIVSVKPSSGLFILPLIFMKKKYILVSLSIILAVYLWPVVVLGNNIDYFIPMIYKALETISGQTTFVHNILSSLRILDINSLSTIKIIIPISGIFILLFSYYRLYKSASEFKIHIALAQVIIVSLLINDPDPDYRMVLLLPLFLITLEMLKSEYIYSLITNTKIKYISLLLSFLILFSFLNIDIPNHLPYYTIFKTIALVYLLYIYCFLLVQPLPLKNKGEINHETR